MVWTKLVTACRHELRTDRTEPGQSQDRMNEKQSQYFLPEMWYRFCVSIIERTECRVQYRAIKLKFDQLSCCLSREGRHEGGNKVEQWVQLTVVVFDNNIGQLSSVDFLPSIQTTFISTYTLVTPSALTVSHMWRLKQNTNTDRQTERCRLIVDWD